MLLPCRDRVINNELFVLLEHRMAVELAQFGQEKKNFIIAKETLF